MGGHAGAILPPQSKADNEIETLQADMLSYGINLGNFSPLFALSTKILECLRIKPDSALGVLTTLLGVGLMPLIVVFIVTALAGQWSGVQIWRWVIVSLWIAFSMIAARLSFSKGVVEQTPMDFAMTKPADYRRMIAWDHRWLNRRNFFAFGVLYAVVSLVCVGLFAGARSFVSEPAGSIAMLAIVFSQTGEVSCGSLGWIFRKRISSELDYLVYWPRPLDSTWVRPALRGQTQNELLRGWTVTGNIIIVAVLLPLESPLLLPTTIVLISTGYAVILASILAHRLCIQRIAARAKEARLVELRTRIDGFGERPTELDEKQFGELTRLLELYDIIDRSPTNLRAFDVVTRLWSSLAIPTVIFVITVVAQEYFGRVAGRILP